MTQTEDHKRAVIAQRLKEARNLAGLSQTKAAELLKMHRPTITEIEAGNPERHLSRRPSQFGTRGVFSDPPFQVLQQN